MSPGSPWGPRPAQIGRSSTHWTSSFPSENNAWQLNMNEQLLIEHGYSLLHYPTTSLLIPICSVKRQNLWVAPPRVFLFHPAASKHATAVPTAELLNCHKMDASGCCHEIRSLKYRLPTNRTIRIEPNITMSEVSFTYQYQDIKEIRCPKYRLYLPIGW